MPEIQPEVVQGGIAFLIIANVAQLMKIVLEFAKTQNGKKKGNGSNGKHVTRELCEAKHEAFKELVNTKDENIHYRLNEFCGTLDKMDEKFDRKLTEIKTEIKNGNAGH